jgi:hypothetical protein
MASSNSVDYHLFGSFVGSCGTRMSSVSESFVLCVHRFTSCLSMDVVDIKVLAVFLTEAITGTAPAEFIDT